MTELGTRKEYPVNDQKGLFVQSAFTLATFSIGMFGAENTVQTLEKPLPKKPEMKN